MRRQVRRGLLALTAVGACGGLLAFRAWHESNQPPVERLALDGSYREMPPDAHHHYLNLPLDYADEAGPQFRDFYILSPDFNAAGPVVFFFTDGQMELVTPASDSAFFDAELPGLSYVLIGHRGHAPTLFPEVYPDGKADLRRALRLYGSAARVEDIERVRRDMRRLNLLPAEGRIMIFAASGAGVLAQQYVDKYPENVSRMLLASTGAPDLSVARNTDYARGFADYDPDAAAALAKLIPQDKVSYGDLSYLLYQLGRQGAAGREAQAGVLAGLLGHDPLPYWWNWLHPSLNYPLARRVLQIPAAEAAKVRMFELLAADLRRTRNFANAEAPLLYAWSAELLADYVRSDLPAPAWRFDRGAFRGEVLVVAGEDDIVFAPRIGAAIAASYANARFLAVPGGHRLEQFRGYHAALRAAFFTHGLHAAPTEALLAAPPRPGVGR